MSTNIARVIRIQLHEPRQWFLFPSNETQNKIYDAKEGL